MPSLIGNKPNQVPTNGDLGRLAFMDNLDSFTSKTVMDTDITNIAPSLNLDFANSKVLDPRITFTRASTATFYNGISSAVAEQNLFLYSQAIGTGGWGGLVGITSALNTTVAPDGTTTASTITASGGTSIRELSQGGLTVTSSVGKTISVYAKAGTNNFIQFIYGGDGNAYANFNVSTGALGTVGSAATASIVDAGNGWYRCIMVTASTAATSPSILLISSATAARAESNTLTTTVFLWGAQIEYRQAVTAYTPTTTAAVTNYIPTLSTAAAGVARFDHNPITGESLGLLIEEQRVNLATYSEDANTYFSYKENTTVSSNTAVSPDGTVTADTAVPASGTSAKLIAKLGITFSAQPYTTSIYAKANGYSWLSFGLYDGAAAYHSWFNLDNGTVGTSQTGNTASIQSVGNGWYRCIVTRTLPSTSSGQDRIHIVNADNTSSFNANGFSGILLWGHQLEAGSFATSYIPTVASQVTRSPDAASMTGTNFSSWYNPAEGSIFTLFNTLGTLGSQRYSLGISDGTSSNRILQYLGTNSTNAIVVTNGLSSATLTSAIVNNTLTRTMLSYSTNNINLLSNGGVASTTSTGNIPSVNRAFIGANETVGTSDFINGHIRKISYYPRRLPNSELVEMTA